MRNIDDMERCPRCGASMDVYERDCPACGADLFKVKAQILRDIRDGDGMTPDAYEVTIEILREGLKPQEPTPKGERKQVTDLTHADLERCPVWEFAIDEEGDPGQNEETLKPRPDLERVDPTDGLFVVPARFDAADGTAFAGFLSLDLEGTNDQPTVVTEAGEHVNFWFGIVKPKSEAVERAYALLGRKATDLFPLRYEATVPTTRDPVRGQIEGFAFYAKYPVVEVRT